MKRLALFTALGLVWACGDSNGPRPTVAGTWHVVTGALGVGSLSPATFDVVVTGVGNDSFTVTMPNITWTNGTDVVFDGGAFTLTISDTTNFGFLEVPTSHTQFCQWLEIYGHKNARLDTLTSAAVHVISGDTVPGGYCVDATSGSATATKQ